MNTLVAQRIAPLPFAHLLRAYLTEAKYEALRMMRAPGFAIPFLLLPVPIYLLFGVVMPGNSPNMTPEVHNFLFVGFSVLAVMGPALFGVGITLAIEREAGLLKLKRALPVPQGAYLLAKMAMAMVFAAIAMAMMITAGLIVGKMTLGFGQLAVLATTMILGALPFCSVGLLIGAYFSGGAAPAIANVIYLPMMWLSGIFIPLPAFLRPWSAIWPAFHLEQLALGVVGGKMAGRMTAPMEVVVLLTITLVCASLAIRKLARKG